MTSSAGTSNAPLQSQPQPRRETPTLPQLSAEQKITERDQQRKIEALYAGSEPQQQGQQQPQPSQSQSRPTTASRTRPTTASATTGPRNYGGVSVNGLGGWNMYDNGGFSGAVGYVYDERELDAPYLVIAANAPAWMHPKELQQAREDHLRQIQRAMYGSALSTRTQDPNLNNSTTISARDAELLLTPEELAQVQERQRYEVRMVQQLLREIRHRGGLDALYEADEERAALGGGNRYGPSSSSSPNASLLLLPEPCIKLDFSTMTPWITDTHLLLILNTLLETSKHLPAAAGGKGIIGGNSRYNSSTSTNRQTPEALTSNVAATLRGIDISKCQYVSSDAVLFVLAELVRSCPSLQHVTYNPNRFGSANAVESERHNRAHNVSPVRGHDHYPATPNIRNSHRNGGISPARQRPTSASANTSAAYSNAYHDTSNISTISNSNSHVNNGSEALTQLENALAEKAIAASRMR